MMCIVLAQSTGTWLIQRLLIINPGSQVICSFCVLHDQLCQQAKAPSLLLFVKGIFCWTLGTQLFLKYEVRIVMYKIYKTHIKPFAICIYGRKKQYYPNQRRQITNFCLSRVYQTDQCYIWLSLFSKFSKHRSTN